MPALSVQNLHKSYGTRPVFDGVSLAVEPGEKVGLIGVNGSGKSTLLRVIAGLEGYQQGTLALQRGLTVGYLPQEPEWEEGDTILRAVAAGEPELRDALSAYHQATALLVAGEGDPQRALERQSAAAARIEALGGWDYEHRLEAMLTRLGVDRWERPVQGLSGGEQKRVALARVLLQQPELLLLDEPTNHLDADTTLWLEQHLLDYPGAVLLITHDRYFLDRVVTRMIEVHRAELVPYSGGYTEYLEAKAERQARLEVEQQKRDRLIEQELAWARRAPSARTGKQKARLDRLDDTLQRRREQEPAAPAAVELRFGQPPRLGRTVLDLHDLALALGGRTLIDGLSTRLRAGERIGIVGPNGAGKTSLLRLILGELQPDQGSVEWGANTRAAYFDQRREDLDPDASVLRAVAPGDWVEVGGQRVHVRSYLHSFLFPSEVHEQRVRSLSGGERNRLLLARLLLDEANLLILDEPTNDLDLVTLRVLENALVDFPGCLLVVTHDRYFLDKIATGLLVFEGDGVVRRHEGGYDLYRRLKEQREQQALELERERASAKTKASAPAPKPAPDRPRKLSYREQKELEGMESAILEAEADKERLGAELADPALYSDEPERVAELGAAYQQASARVDALYARWEELEEIRTGTS